MITRVLVIAQGPSDLGFLQGFRNLLGCEAEIIDYRQNPLLRQRAKLLKRAQAKLIHEELLGRHPADLIVRLTDGDAESPQNTIRDELEQWPEESRSLLVCGVCDRDVEHWMCLDPDYAADRLEFKRKDLPAQRKARSGFIKDRIRELCSAQAYADFVASFVSNAPPKTLRRWLSNPAFSSFYDQCRDAAQQHDCPVKNLRDATETGQ